MVTKKQESSGPGFSTKFQPSSRTWP